MSENETKVNCRLFSIGTDKANAKANEDLISPDPEPGVGKDIISKAIEKEEKKDLSNGDKQESSR